MAFPEVPLRKGTSSHSNQKPDSRESCVAHPNCNLPLQLYLQIMKNFLYKIFLQKFLPLRVQGPIKLGVTNF